MDTIVLKKMQDIAMHEAQVGQSAYGLWGLVIINVGLFVGFLIQWPTLITVVMAPILIIRYIRLAKKEEAYMLEHYPKEYGAYMQKVPAWIPKFS